MTHDEMIAVIQAAKEKKPLEFRYQRSAEYEPDTWKPVEKDYGEFDFLRFVYRIKPEPSKPREIWINYYPNQSEPYGYAYGNMEDAVKNKNVEDGVTLHFREVPTCKCGSEVAAFGNLCLTCDADRQGLQVMNERDRKLLEDEGWTIDCESPFEISMEDEHGNTIGEAKGVDAEEILRNLDYWDTLADPH